MLTPQQCTLRVTGVRVTSPVWMVRHVTIIRRCVQGGQSVLGTDWMRWDVSSYDQLMFNNPQRIICVCEFSRVLVFRCTYASHYFFAIRLSQVNAVLGKRFL